MYLFNIFLYHSHQLNMTRYFYTIILLAISGLTGLTSAQQGYNISVSISGAENSFLTIGYHMGDKQYVRDTLQTDSQGHAIYKGDKKLEQGLYIILLPDNRYFDIIIGDDQNFSISCDRSDIVGTMKVEGSDENNAFIAYQRGWMALQDKSRVLREKLSDPSVDSSEKAGIQNQLSDHENEMINFLRQTSANNPGTVLAMLVDALVPMDMPDFDIPEGTPSADSLRWLMAYRYNIDHFFDNVDLSDRRLIRTPVLHSKLNTYFTRIVIQHPDTLNRVIPRIIEKSEGDSVMFRYLVVFVFNHFRESQIMGHDGVTVKIIDDYYLSGKANWVSEETLTSLRRDADRLRTNLIGRTAVDLVMETYAGDFRSLHDIDSEFTILYFWEPNCGHCKTSTPILKKLYEDHHADGIEVFAVCTQDNRDEWENYIAENQLTWINAWDPSRESHFDFFYNVNATPMVYILDRDKKIIAKKLPVENIWDFISDYRKFGW